MEKYDKVTDEQLIRDFRNGDREIMDHLMMKYKAMVRKIWCEARQNPCIFWAETAKI